MIAKITKCNGINDAESKSKLWLGPRLVTIESRVVLYCDMLYWFVAYEQ